MNSESKMTSEVAGWFSAICPSMISKLNLAPATKGKDDMEQTSASGQTSPRDPHDLENSVASSSTGAGSAPGVHSMVRPGSLTQASPAEKLGVCNALAAMFYGVSSEAFEARIRNERRINEARQLGMYLANTCLCVDYEEIARVSRRDRTTVRYSVERVEDRRENPQFDSVLVVFETLIACFQNREVADMIENGLHIDHDIVAYVPKAD